MTVKERSRCTYDYYKCKDILKVVLSNIDSRKSKETRSLLTIHDFVCEYCMHTFEFLLALCAHRIHPGLLLYHKLDI